MTDRELLLEAHKMLHRLEFCNEDNCEFFFCPVCSMRVEVGHEDCEYEDLLKKLDDHLAGDA